jgi:hypothetical protein
MLGMKFNCIMINFDAARHATISLALHELHDSGGYARVDDYQPQPPASSGLPRVLYMPTHTLGSLVQDGLNIPSLFMNVSQHCTYLFCESAS